jgi:hypothetical protein
MREIRVSALRWMCLRPGGRRWLRAGADFARRDAVGVVMQA